MISTAARTADLFDLSWTNAFSDSRRAGNSWHSNFRSIASEACFEIAKRSCAPEPHFVWEDLTSVNISPSEFQLFSLDWGSDELVTIEEEDLPWRAYCLEAVDALERYALLEAGWDGDEAPAPTVASLNDAHLFLRLLSCEVDSCPTITPVLDHEGIPSFILDTGKTYVSISLYGENSITVYTIDRETRKNSACTYDFFDSEKLNATLDLIKSL